MRAHVNGTEIFFDTEGSALVPRGQAMEEHQTCFVLHGGPGMDHTYFRPWLTPLAEDLQLVYVDHRGNGRSQRMAHEAYTIESMADDLEQLRIYLGIERPIVLGNSFGGMLAQLYAIRYPGRASRLILISTTPSHQYQEEASAIAEERGTDEQKRAMYDLLEGRVQSDVEFQRWWEIMLPLYFYRYDEAIGGAMLGRTIGNVDIVHYMFAHEFPKFDVRPQLGEIQVPTLVLAGRHDWVTPPSQSELIHRGIAGSEYVLFENSGHMPFIEEQDACLDTIRRFLGLHAGHEATHVL